MFRCTVCGVNATSDKNLQEHFRGWSHLRKLDAAKLAERTVYVRGFTSDVSQSSLQGYLEEQIGSVNSVWMNKDVKYALVEFQDSVDALKALQTPDLWLSGKKLVIKPRHTHHKGKQPQSPCAESASRSNSHQLVGNVLDVDVQQILSIPELEGQLKFVADLNTMSPSVLESQLVVVFQLLKLLRRSFPYCLLVPFGSTISGLGTQHSDSDLSLVLCPSAAETALLTGHNYFSPPLLSIVERLEREYDIKLCPPPSPPPPEVEMAPEGEEEGEKEEEEEPSPSTSSAHPEVSSKKARVAHNRPIFRKMESLLRSEDNYTAITSIPFARCPIIRFVHKPTSLHCDMSINSILGALNSRLVRSYCELDHRVAVLISVLKLWTRVMSIPKLELNSYGLSLMVIYFLQRCSPPVLPCLQSPGPWARNMEWYGQNVWKGVSNNQLDSQLVAPWDVSFTPSNAFHPSTNSESTASLLRQFFKFYSEFDYFKNAVSIKTSRDKPLTVREAILQAKERKINPRRFDTPLVVQDPFELSHNVAKMVSMDTLRKWQECVSHSSQVLETELGKVWGPWSVLPVFGVPDHMDPRPGKKQGKEASVPLVFSLQRTLHLLQNTEAGVALAQQFTELDLNNSTIRKELGQLLLRMVMTVLQSRYGFAYMASEEEEPGARHMDIVSEGYVAVCRETEAKFGGRRGRGRGRGRGRTGNKTNGAEGGERSMLLVGDMAVCEEGGVGGEEGGVVGDVAQVLADESMEDAMETSGIDEAGIEEVGSEEQNCKRTLCDQDEEMVVDAEHKRSKVQESDKSALDLLHGLLCEEPHTWSYVCTVHSNTWLHARKARRHADSAPQEATPDVETQLCVPPLLKLKVYLVHPETRTDSTEELCVLEVRKVEGSREDFFTFMAVLKKLLYGGT